MATGSEAENDVLQIYQVYKQEATSARQSRIDKNKLNFDCYNLNQDFSEKNKGQSSEFLPKLSMAVEQSANYMQQGLIDLGDWFKVQPSPGLNEDTMRVKPSEIYKLTSRQLNKCNFVTQVGNATKLGLLGSLMIAKVHGGLVNKPRYVVKAESKNGAIKKRLIKQEDKVWQLKIDLVRQEDFYVDPTGRGLYLMQDIYMDYYEIERLSSGPNAIYDKSIVRENLKGSGIGSNSLHDYNRNRESGQDYSHNGRRNKIKVTEIWGNFINVDGELIYENCVATIANDTHVIQRPSPNPYWHGLPPFICAPILSVHGNPWGKALMDAPAMLNQAINEMFNLILDGGLMSVHGIKQIREHWLADPSQVDNGISAGDTLRANTSCPAGATVLERIDTATVPQDGINVYNLLNQEFNTSALTNDLRMGVQPFRQVKATEIVEASQSITSMFTGLAKRLETDWITKILEMSWATCAQHMQDLDDDEIVALIGSKRSQQLMAMGPEELFAETVQGCKFEVYGISANLNKQKDFTKIQALLQTVGSSPILMEEFAKIGDFSKLLKEIIRSLDINMAKIENEEHAAEANEILGGQVPGEVPNDQSQIPQAGAAGNQADMTMASMAQPGGPIAGPNFPPSRATAG